jgi:hypothetical protein
MTGSMALKRDEIEGRTGVRGGPPILGGAGGRVDRRDVMNASFYALFRVVDPAGVLNPDCPGTLGVSGIAQR